MQHSHRPQIEEPKVDYMQPRIPPPFLMLLAACLMWALRRWLPLGQLIPTPWNRLAVLPAAVGVAIAAAAFVRFRQARTTVNPMDPRKASRLVTGGVFRISRNPMYLGLLLLLIGWAVWLGTASTWLVPPLFVIVISVAQIAPEEQALEELFGEEYRAYRQRVARWIGRVLILIVALCLGWARSEPPSALQPGATFLKAARLLDVHTGHYIEQAGIWIEGERVKEVGRASDIQPHVPGNAAVIDLKGATVMAGLIDCHTHLMARFADGPDGYILSLAKKSQAFRALEGASDARVTLHAGFTTVRDVENEGSGYADVALRDAINQGLVEGPRMLVATRGIAAVGQYKPFGVSPDLADFPAGAQMISGAEDARRAVREQIGYGADLIKIYADWEYPTLTVEEMRVIIEEAHKAGRKVAAHATTPEGIKNAVTAGVDSIEHGHRADREALEMMKEKGILLVPTVGAIDEFLEAHKLETLTPERRKRRDAFLKDILQSIQLAMSLGVKMASGFDASREGLHGKNAQELVSLVSRGVPPLEAIRAATLNAAELLGWQDRVGVIEADRYADIIAVLGDPLTDITVLTRVEFVMKGGKVVKDAQRE